MNEIIHLYLWFALIVSLLGSTVFVLPAMDLAEYNNVKNSFTKSKGKFLIVSQIVHLILAPVMALCLVSPKRSRICKQIFNDLITQPNSKYI